MNFQQSFLEIVYLRMPGRFRWQKGSRNDAKPDGRKGAKIRHVTRRRCWGEILRCCRGGVAWVILCVSAWTLRLCV